MNSAVTTCASNDEAIGPGVASARRTAPGAGGGGFATKCVTSTRAQNGDVIFSKSGFALRKAVPLSRDEPASRTS